MFCNICDILQKQFSLLLKKLKQNSFFMDSHSKENPEKNKIFLNVDHLKKGTYELNILLKNKIIKTVTLKRI